MTRFQKLAAATLAMTLALVIVGVVVRATGSGLGCPDWPFCYGRAIPPLEFKAWAEWIHRLIAAIVGAMVFGLALLAVADHRDRLSLLAASLGALVLVGFQAWLGRETVRLGNTGESVTAHLVAAVAMAGLLTFLLVRARHPARLAGRGGSQGFTLLAAFSAAATFALLVFGANVTARDAALIFPDWPLMGGAIVPPFGDMPADAATLAFTHALHRYVGVVVGVVLAGTWVAAWRGRRAGRVDGTFFRLITIAAVLYPFQAVVGALQVWTQLAPWTQALHVALATFIWTAAVGATFVSYYRARAATPAPATGTGGAAGPASPDTGVSGPGGRSPADTVRAYIALTKPRIIELLLITTVPAMVLATRDLPGVDWVEWGWLVVWTLVGGTLAAGSANAINQYLERDIDILMTRTRRRPLPAHAVEPEHAVVFGVLLGVVAIALLAWFVNLVAAFLALLAIAFYVFVYTIFLKRTTTQNIVIGGAAGALPPVIGWAAVTGSVEVPALLLFALVFYWTPPHFWALSLRIAKDYAAAGVPMLPVVRGSAETTRQIFLYTILLVAISLVFFAVAQMGLIYLVAAVVMGALFLWQAGRLART
ncbi:MAG TPA: heme o synthase, partial [Patescibacteria group bacterium]|nr:heme o synthase [Patescibacteria group bacterium]